MYLENILITRRILTPDTLLKKHQYPLFIDKKSITYWLDHAMVWNIDIQALHALTYKLVQKISCNKISNVTFFLLSGTQKRAWYLCIISLTSPHIIFSNKSSHHQQNILRISKHIIFAYLLQTINQNSLAAKGHLMLQHICCSKFIPSIIFVSYVFGLVDSSI